MGAGCSRNASQPSDAKGKVPGSPSQDKLSEKYQQVDGASASGRRLGEGRLSDEANVYTTLDPEKLHHVRLSEKVVLSTEPKQTLKALVAYQSLGGEEPGYRKSNQDSCFSKSNLSGTQRALFGVFDGHGPSGHHVAAFVKDNFP
eukprot:5566207-Pyramimonas_sp.AAC.2